ncbi:MAG: ATP-binding cassette domain-containing protein [Frankiales bacterium]|nr:ATP-binding cassette domain-containing protein [Frankiales bacterium]
MGAVDSSRAPKYDYVPVLEARDVTVRYGGIRAVEGVSFGLRPGEVSGILGPNGSGKTTLLGALTRMVQLTRGEIRCGGTDYSKVKPERVIGLGISRTFQTVRLLPERTVWDNIVLSTDVVLSSRSADIEGLVRQAIARTGLEGFEKARPDELSYGVQRRVEIARAIAVQPRVLLLDEPTAGMTKTERADISRLIGSLRSEGLTQLLVEHDVAMMVDTCDYLYAMNFGSLIAEGSPQDVVRNAAVQEAYLGKHGRQHA